MVSNSKHYMQRSKRIRPFRKTLGIAGSAPTYKMPNLPCLAENTAYQATLDLVFKGKEQPSGYTEPLLHAYRLQLKQNKNAFKTRIFQI